MLQTENSCYLHKDNAYQLPLPVPVISELLHVFHDVLPTVHYIIINITTSINPAARIPYISRLYSTSIIFIVINKKMEKKFK